VIPSQASQRHDPRKSGPVGDDGNLIPRMSRFVSLSGESDGGICSSAWRRYATAYASFFIACRSSDHPLPPRRLASCKIPVFREYPPEQAGSFRLRQVQEKPADVLAEHATRRLAPEVWAVVGHAARRDIDDELVGGDGAPPAGRSTRSEVRRRSLIAGTLEATAPCGVSQQLGERHGREALCWRRGQSLLSKTKLSGQTEALERCSDASLDEVSLIGGVLGAIGRSAEVLLGAAGVGRRMNRILPIAWISIELRVLRISFARPWPAVRATRRTLSGHDCCLLGR
jgi:hypothetical protein